MKNIYYIVIFILFTANIFSQNISGNIIYNIKPINFEVKSNVDTESKNFINDIKSYAEIQSFILEFNDRLSKFVLKENLDSESNSSEKQAFNKLALTRFTSEYNYFLDRKDNYELFQHNDGTLVKKKYEKIQWEITTESKTIDGYLCYKAIYNKSYLARDKKIKINKIVAWFAPSLPYGFGPKEYNGTPGLILELQEFETTYYASKINVSKDLSLKINFPNGKIINEEEYNKKVLSN